MSSYGKLDPIFDREPKTACGATMAGNSFPKEDDRRAETTEDPRNRRKTPRMSDIERAVYKRCGEIPPVDPELDKMLAKLKPEFQTGIKVTGTEKPCTYGSGEETHQTAAYDKNTPESLKQLRWELYKLVDKRLLGDTMKMEIEDLFKEYTNS